MPGSLPRAASCATSVVIHWCTAALAKSVRVCVTVSSGHAPARSASPVIRAIRRFAIRSPCESVSGVSVATAAISCVTAACGSSTAAQSHADSLAIKPAKYGLHPAAPSTSGCRSACNPAQAASASCPRSNSNGRGVRRMCEASEVMGICGLCVASTLPSGAGKNQQFLDAIEAAAAQRRPTG